MLPQLHGIAQEVAQRLRGTTGADPITGVETIDWSNPATLDISGYFTPGASTRLVDVDRGPVTTKPTFYCDADADVTASDRLVVRDRVWDVDDDPAIWNPGGNPSGMVVTLKAVSG